MASQGSKEKMRERPWIETANLEVQPVVGSIREFSVWFRIRCVVLRDLSRVTNQWMGWAHPEGLPSSFEIQGIFSLLLLLLFWVMVAHSCLTRNLPSWPDSPQTCDPSALTFGVLGLQESLSPAKAIVFYSPRPTCPVLRVEPRLWHAWRVLWNWAISEDPRMVLFGS